MRASLSVLLVAGAVATGSLLAAAGGPSGDSTPAEDFVRRLLATHAEDRAKADAELGAADRDTAIAVARALRDQFGPALPRLATTTSGVKVHSRWITVAPADVACLFGVDACATVPTRSSRPMTDVLAVIQRSATVQMLSAAEVTVYDDQQAMASILNRSPGRPSSFSTGALLGFRPKIAADGKSVRLDLSLETRHPTATPEFAVMGASWRSEFDVANGSDVILVFPAAFAATADARRLALALHVETVDLGASAIGQPIRDFDVVFGGDDRTPPGR